MAKRSTEWYAWGGLALSAFAVLEHQAIKSRGTKPTLSNVLRHHTRQSPRRKTAAMVGYAGFSAWFVYHILYQELTDDGLSHKGI